MDDFMMDLELMQLLEEEEAPKTEAEAEKEVTREGSVSPYRTVQQEIFGQYVAMFQGLDDLLQQWEAELDAVEEENEEGSEKP